MQSPNQRKSAIAFGIALIALVFLMETLVASRIAASSNSASPALPYVIAFLVVVGVGALVAGFIYRRRR